MISALYVSALLFSVLGDSFVHKAPRQTSAAEEIFDPKGWSPRPTDSPNNPVNLFRRQAFPNDAGTALVAPDATCGFISGLQGAPFSCSAKYKCVMFSATGGNYGPIACCTTGMTCKIRTACVASTDYYGTASDKFCDDGCRMDLYTLKCTDRAEPFCGGIRFTNPNVQDFWCVTSSVSTWHSAATTFIGQTQQRVFSKVDRSELFGGSSTSSSRSSSTSATSPSQTTDGPSGITSLPADPTQTQRKASKPTGAIIGGVLGSIALIALLGFGIFIVRRKYDNKNPAVQLPLPQDPYAYHPHPGAGPSEMDSQADDPRQSYAMANSPHSYNAGMVQQHFDPPKAPEPHIEPQEMYTPQIFQKQYQSVPMENPDSQGYHHQSQSLSPNSRNLSMTSGTTSDTGLVGSMLPRGSPRPPIPPKLV